MFRITEKALNTTAFSWLKVGWLAKRVGFNQETLVGAFSVIPNLRMDLRFKL